MHCRSCGCVDFWEFADLGSAPPSNNLLDPTKILKQETEFPLRTFACVNCFLVQTEDFVEAEVMFNPDYVYLSSNSDTWLDHAQNFVKKSIASQSLDTESQVYEIAANDGYLLQYFKDSFVPCVGIEPTALAAGIARNKGIEIEEAFFDEDLADKLVEKYGPADLIVANNVLAHVPDPKVLLRGIAKLLKLDGVASIEFHSLIELKNKLAIDTIYHEHFSYYSLTSFKIVSEMCGLRVVSVEKLPTHGGSLRVKLAKSESPQIEDVSVRQTLTQEKEAGITKAEFYLGFGKEIEQIKSSFRDFLKSCERENKVVAGYGAAAKASTLLNYAKITPEELSAVADRSPSKIGKLIPGSGIPVVAPDQLREIDPDFVIIFPWNIATEIIQQLSTELKPSTKFVKLIPNIQQLN